MKHIMTKPLNEAQANYGLILTTFASLILGSLLTLLFSDAFSNDLPQTLLIALIFSLLWLTFYNIKNYHQSSVVKGKKYSVLLLLPITGGLIWYLLSQFNGYSVPLSAIVIWPAAFILVYQVAESLGAPEDDKFVFHNGAEPRTEFNNLHKVKISKEQIAFHIDNDGLDPQIIFNVEKTGASHLITIHGANAADKFSDYLSGQKVIIEALGIPIEGVVLMEMQFNGSKGYYQIVDDLDSPESKPLCSIDIALLENSDQLNQRVETAITEMLKAHTPLSAKKIDVVNYQSMLKFHMYVKRLKDKENGSLDYLSTCEGTLEICNSSYVELYNCNLQSTLTSWVNQNGLIRTDRADDELQAEENGKPQLNKIKLHFADCCLTDIQLIKNKEDNNNSCIKLHLTLTELNDGELTDKNSTLNLRMEDKSISVSTEAIEQADLISVAQYFEQKTVQTLI